jgi:hypothetical protein
MIGHLGVVVEMEGLLYVANAIPAQRNHSSLARFERQFLKVEYYQ